MRYLLVFTACFALQLSVFTCGFDIHVHAADSDVGHIAQHNHAQNDTHQQAADHGCHVHTSHTFVEVAVTNLEAMSIIAFAPTHVWAAPKLKSLLFSIEYPPKA